MLNPIKLQIAEQFLWALIAGWLGINTILAIGALAFAKIGWTILYSANPGLLQHIALEFMQSYYNTLLTR
jgi:hypothetical protein